MSNTSINYDMLSRQQNGRLTHLILAGPPGAGKTHAAMSLLRPGDPFSRIAAAGKCKEDFTTYPVPEKIDDTWQISQPITESSLLPLLAKNIGDGYGVLLVDDVTAADPGVQSALLELAQFGRIGEHQLGINVAIVMTGNGIGDGAYAAQWSSALVNRGHYVEYRASMEVWKDLPENKNVDPIIYGFLLENPLFFAPEVVNEEDNKKCFDDKGRAPSARQWTTLGNALMDKWNGMQNFKPSILFPSASTFVASLVGDKAAMAVQTYADIMIRYPTARELMEDPGSWKRKVSPEDERRKSSVYAVAHSLRQHVVSLNDQLNEKLSSMKSKEALRVKDEVICKFVHALKPLMDRDREMGAFAVRYVLQSVPADDPIKGSLSNYVFGLNDADPVIKEDMAKVLEDVKAMGAVI